MNKKSSHTSSHLLLQKKCSWRKKTPSSAQTKGIAWVEKWIGQKKTKGPCTQWGLSFHCGEVPGDGFASKVLHKLAAGSAVSAQHTVFLTFCSETSPALKKLFKQV